MQTNYAVEIVSGPALRKLETAYGVVCKEAIRREVNARQTVRGCSKQGRNTWKTASRVYLASLGKTI